MEKQDLHGARVHPSLKRLAYSRIDLSLCSVSLHLKGTWEEPPDILCESCACIIHTNLQSCMSIFSETLHDHHISEESLRDSNQLLGT